MRAFRRSRAAAITLLLVSIASPTLADETGCVSTRIVPIANAPDTYCRHHLVSACQTRVACRVTTEMLTTRGTTYIYDEDIVVEPGKEAPSGQLQSMGCHPVVYACHTVPADFLFTSEQSPDAGTVIVSRGGHLKPAK